MGFEDLHQSVCEDTVEQRIEDLRPKFTPQQTNRAVRSGKRDGTRLRHTLVSNSTNTDGRTFASRVKQSNSGVLRFTRLVVFFFLLSMLGAGILRPRYRPESLDRRAHRRVLDRLVVVPDAFSVGVGR